MKPVQWLMVGGPADGHLLRLGNRRFALCDGVTYEGFTYGFRGELYRVGRPLDGVVVLDRVDRLIEQKKPEPLAASMA